MNGNYQIERTYPGDGTRAGTWRGYADSEEGARIKAAAVDEAGPRYDTGKAIFLGTEAFATGQEKRDFFDSLKPIDFSLSR